MTIEKVKELPERKERTRRTRGETIRTLDNIIDANVKFGKLTFNTNEYVSIYSARAALRNNAINKGYPLKFKMRNGELYFIRTDM